MLNHRGSITMVLRIITFTCLIQIWVSTAGLGQENRIKELVNIKGYRSNELMGFGLVIGLNGTGDSQESFSTNKAVSTLLSRLGMFADGAPIITQSAAAVIVTAQLPAFARVGDKIDVKVSVIGDASSLAGGTLLMTPLKAGDGNIYAIAQGSIVVGQANGEGAKTLTVAHLSNGGQIERSYSPNFVEHDKIELSLKKPDFTTNSRITKVINQFFKGFFAKSINPSLIEVHLPPRYLDRPVEFIAELEAIKVKIDLPAIVVLNERTGTIVMGGDIRISKIVLSHDGLSITVGEENQGKTESVVPIEGTTVGDLVEKLNAMGVKAPDLISILQSLHASGALKAEIRYL